MRKLSLCVIMALFLMAGYATFVLPAPNFTWEGELNPNEFDKWQRLSVKSINPRMFWVFIRNSDLLSPIDIVAMAVDLSNTLVGYQYFKDGVPYSYRLDSNQNKYVSVNLTEKQQQRCIKCHTKDQQQI